MARKKTSQPSTAPPDGQTNSRAWSALARAALMATAGVLTYIGTQLMIGQPTIKVDSRIMVDPTINMNPTLHAPPPVTAPLDSSARNPVDPAPAAPTIAREATYEARFQPAFCAISETQTVHDVLEEADAKYRLKDYVAALERYGCVEAKLAAGRRPPRQRVQQALRTKNRTPLENEMVAREMYDLFQPIRIQPEDDL